MGELQAADTRGRPRRVLAGIGAYARQVALLIAQTVGTAIGVLRAAARPSTWRRTVRAELWSQLHAVGVRAVGSVLVVGALIGLGLVFQALFWLESVGQEALVGAILVRGLVRDTAPFIVVLIMIGRSGSLLVVDLVHLREGGQLRALESHGIDPFELLVVPRVLALAISTFVLTVFFIVAALLAGYFASQVLGSSDLGLAEFLNSVLADMKADDYALVLVKCPVLGFAAGVIAAVSALGRLELRHGADRQLPRSFIRSLLAVMVLSLVLDLAL